MRTERSPEPFEDMKKEGESMRALYFAQRVILRKKAVDQVPAKLQEDVAAILVDESGLPELVPLQLIEIYEIPVRCSDWTVERRNRLGNKRKFQPVVSCIQ